MRRIFNKSKLNKLKKEDVITILDGILEIAEENADISDFGLNAVIYLEEKNLIDEI